MPRAKRAGLKESDFLDGPEDQPYFIAAHEDCIQVHHGATGEEKILTLRPRHIRSIAAMYEDWWESHWARIHEEEA